MSKNRNRAMEAYDWKNDERITGASPVAQFALFRLALAADRLGAVDDLGDGNRFGLRVEQFGDAMQELQGAGLVERGLKDRGWELPDVRRYLRKCHRAAISGRQAWEQRRVPLMMPPKEEGRP